MRWPQDSALSFLGVSLRFHFWVSLAFSFPFFQPLYSFPSNLPASPNPLPSYNPSFPFNLISCPFSRVFLVSPRLFFFLFLLLWGNSCEGLRFAMLCADDVLWHQGTAASCASHQQWQAHICVTGGKKKKQLTCLDQVFQSIYHKRDFLLLKRLLWGREKNQTYMELSGDDLSEVSGLSFVYQRCFFVYQRCFFFVCLFSDFASSGEISELI